MARPSVWAKPLVKAAKAKGWTVGLTKKGHLRFVAPEGTVDQLTGEPVRVVGAPGTPSDHRGYLNTRAQLRRAGVDC